MTTPSDTAHPEGERELLPCPFCGLRLERSEAFSGRLRAVYVHALQDDDAYICPAHDFRVTENDQPRIAAWNTRPVVRPQGEEGLARELLAEEYERGGAEGSYPSYADLARSGSGAFTLCSIRAIQRALALSNQGKPSS